MFGAADTFSRFVLLLTRDASRRDSLDAFCEQRVRIAKCVGGWGNRRWELIDFPLREILGFDHELLQPSHDTQARTALGSLCLFPQLFSTVSACRRYASVHDCKPHSCSGYTRIRLTSHRAGALQENVLAARWVARLRDVTAQHSFRSCICTLLLSLVAPFAIQHASLITCQVTSPVTKCGATSSGECIHIALRRAHSLPTFFFCSGSCSRQRLQRFEL